MFTSMTEIKKRGNFREKNGFWKGGKSIASNGYVLIKVGFDHHLADVRGYAYEHRLNAENKLGRKLLPGEEVHHDDENKLNNEEYNLIITKNKIEHRFLHRKSDTGKRLPGEDNPLIKCSCGCKTKFLKYDNINRPRSYISGHNPPKAPLQNKILNLISKKTMCRKEISSSLDVPIKIIGTTLSKMVKNGLLTRPTRAYYCKTKKSKHDRCI